MSQQPLLLRSAQVLTWRRAVLPRKTEDPARHAMPERNSVTV